MNLSQYNLDRSAPPAGCTVRCLWEASVCGKFWKESDIWFLCELGVGEEANWWHWAQRKGCGNRSIFGWAGQGVPLSRERNTAMFMKPETKCCIYLCMSVSSQSEAPKITVIDHKHIGIVPHRRWRQKTVTTDPSLLVTKERSVWFCCFSLSPIRTEQQRRCLAECPSSHYPYN